MVKPAPRGKLRNKIFWLMVLVSAVPIMLAAFLNRYNLTLAHRIDVANLEGTLLEQKAAEIGDYLSRLRGLLRLTVSYSGSADFDLTVKSFLAKQMLGYSPAFLDIAFLGADGRETYRADQAHPNGVDSKTLIDRSLSGEFLAAKNGNDYLGNISFNGVTPTFAMASPVKNTSGSVVSIISADLSLAPIADLVRGATLGNTGYLYLVDKSGRLVGGGGIFGGQSGVDVKNIGVVSAVLSGQNFLGSDTQQRYDNFISQPIVAAGTYLEDYGWGLISEWPVAEADAVVNRIFWQNILISLLVLMAVIVLSVILAGLIVKPVRKLEKGTERVAAGKFEEPVEIKTGDELEELGEAFNEMMKGLKRLRELKDEFVFIAAHELKTPVAAMKGYAELILTGVTGAVSEKTQDFVQKIKKANERLVQLVSDLLEVARSEAGKLLIKVAPIDAATPIRETLTELKSLADEKGIRLIYEPPADLPKILADVDRLKEVMVNLVGNSIKYMGGQGTVNVFHEVQGGSLITRVEDSGIGIPKDAQVHLFEKFYRVPSEKTQGISGTGLGLFIVKEIIEKMGGRIWFESEEGRGTTFFFNLPIAS